MSYKDSSFFDFDRYNSMYYKFIDLECDDDDDYKE